MFFGYEPRWTMMGNRRSDGALVRITRAVGFMDTTYDHSSFFIVETWKPRREPRNFQWVGDPSDR